MKWRNTGFKTEAVCSTEKASPLNVQGDSGGNVNHLVDNTNRHREKKIFEHVTKLLPSLRIQMLCEWY
jgi:hypothetical protein